MRWSVVMTGLLSLMVVWNAGAETKPVRLSEAERKMNAGNFKDAFADFQKLSEDETTSAVNAARAVLHGVQCLQHLGRINEIDEFRESAAKTHCQKWGVLHAVAKTYLEVDHNGVIVAGKFERGPHRGGDGRHVHASQRDRVRALQLFTQALPAALNDDHKPAVSAFLWDFAAALVQGDFSEAWRLQTLTDLTVLSDYEEGQFWWRGHESPGAPVDANGDPVFHAMPQRYEAAKSDGERWRWLLAQTVEMEPIRKNEVLTHFANFLQSQFGVETLAHFSWWSRWAEESPNGGGADDESRKTGTFALHTLADDETIARLATGVKRFKLPEEFNPLRVWQQIVAGGRSEWGKQASDQIARFYENRRQYPKAVEAWKQATTEYGPGDETGHGPHRTLALDQIVQNWGRLEPSKTLPAGRGATVDYRFRNGTSVTFTAHELNIDKLLADVKKYLKSGATQLDWQQFNIQDIGHRVVVDNQQQYRGAKVAEWSLDLKPRPNHVDDRITVATPLQRPGAYLVESKMGNGNVSRIVLWVADTVIVKKQLEQKSFYFVADAVTGQPIAKANVEFLGWKQEQVAPNRRQWRVLTRNFAEFSNADGQLVLGPTQQPTDHQWAIIARTDSGRLAYHGFTHVWFQERHDPDYHQIKTFTITDRPVYRPGQKVQFKHWIGEAKYDQPNATRFANSDIQVEILNAKGERVFEQVIRSDEFGGVAGEFELPKDATLGVWQANVRVRPDGVFGGGGSFRVEEYKKPEFEVKVEAPREPVALGDKITATIRANYYFGGAVTKAKVKYKVLRTDHRSEWYPLATWDWFYGRGYWWFASDYDWYPGWRRWGCARPLPFWWGHRHEPPEVVLERETEIGADGTVSVEIDTALAKEVHGDSDHSYSITAEVIDQSRRTIVGTGNVLVAREPFRVFAWVNRGHYRVGDDILAEFRAQTVDQKPVQGNGDLTLYAITYNEKNEPVETAVQTWKLDANAEGYARQQMKAAKAGQYRLSYKLRARSDRIHAVDSAKDASKQGPDESGHYEREGGYLFVVRGDSFDGHEFRFNDLELVTEKREYTAGETVRLMVNTNKAGGAVLLFLRPTNGVYLPPKLIRLDGKSHVEEIAVVQRDMPNFFVEAVTVADAKVHQEVREIVVPPEKRVLNVAVQPSQDEYKPGAPAKVQVKLTDSNGKPFVGSTVLSIYDRSIEYISGGSNVPEIREFFWKWRRQHHPQTEHSLSRHTYELLKSDEVGMSDLGMFGGSVIEEMQRGEVLGGRMGRMMPMAAAPGGMGGMAGGALAKNRLAMADGVAAPESAAAEFTADKTVLGDDRSPLPNAVQPTVRSHFADTAFWAASVTTNNDGLAEVSLTMPEQLTGWKVKCWAMGLGTRVGQGEAEITTKKNLLVRLQTPRFFIQTDEVVLTANVHNYLKIDKEVEAVLEIDERLMRPVGDANAQQISRNALASGSEGIGGNSKPDASAFRLMRLSKRVRVKAGGEQRVDWRVNIIDEGEAIVRMSALTDEESDAMEMKFPVFVHGMLKTESWSGVIRPDKNSGKVTINVPKERRANQTRLEVRYSPTLAGAMVDALPYMVEYPYGCTEQTLNRFLPTVVTQRILRNMGLDLKAIQQKRTNLNAQEIGDYVERAKQWKRFDRNPVFDEAEVAAMVKSGLERLTEMQVSDGGWGWFSGWGERSYAHTTAVVVHGLLTARENDVAIVPGVLERGIEWLKRHQSDEVTKLKNALKETKVQPWKERADALDALVYMVLVDADYANADMLEFLHRDRVHLPVYAKALFGLALHKQKQADKLAMILQNIEQFLVEDDENQTAYLKLPENNSWWFWYGSDIEANAYYLKLLSRVDAKDERASRLVKYLLNNRKHATYWNSTRDSAICIEAMAEYLKASGEDKPNLLVEVLIDGELKQTVEITPETLFAFNNKFVIEGEGLTAGEHVVELRKKGLAPKPAGEPEGVSPRTTPAQRPGADAARLARSSPLYFNAYLTNFTLEDFITKAGLEVKVNRKYYKLTPVDKKVNVAGSRGQVVSQKVEKYERTELANLDTLKSGDLVEVEMEIDSKNDYEYLLFEDPKASGFEPVEVRSGYNGNEMGAYVEFRDERVVFFVRALARGQHSLSYRLRAEIPGKFSALPTKASAMYAPELKANSDEIKLAIED